MLLLACSQAGSWSPSEPDSDARVQDAPPGDGDLVITEIHRDPEATDDDVGEWFELRSLSDQTLALDTVAVSDADDHGFGLAGLLLPGASLLVAAVLDASINGGLSPALSWEGSDFHLGNDEDEVKIEVGGDTLDRVRWDEDFPGGEGAAMALDPGAQDPAQNDDAEAWCRATTAYGAGDQGTPGRENLACE